MIDLALVEAVSKVPMCFSCIALSGLEREYCENRDIHFFSFVSVFEQKQVF